MLNRRLTASNTHYSVHGGIIPQYKAQSAPALFCPRGHHPTIQSMECSCVILSTGASSHNTKHGVLLPATAWMKHAQRPVSGMYVSQGCMCLRDVCVSGMYEPTDVNHQIRPLRRERGASVRLGLGRAGKGVPAGGAPRCGWALAGRGKECLLG